MFLHPIWTNVHAEKCRILKSSLLLIPFRRYEGSGVRKNWKIKRKYAGSLLSADMLNTCRRSSQLFLFSLTSNALLDIMQLVSSITFILLSHCLKANKSFTLGLKMWMPHCKWRKSRLASGRSIIIHLGSDNTNSNSTDLG